MHSLEYIVQSLKWAGNKNRTSYATVRMTSHQLELQLPEEVDT